MPRSYTTSQLAAAADVNVETVRYYHRRKLLVEPRRPAGKTRRYSDADAERLRFIKRAQRMGFALGEIEGLLELLTTRSCSKTRKIAAMKLAVIDDRLRDLNRLRDDLARLIGECDANDDDARCPIIERFVEPVEATATSCCSGSGKTAVA